jgi:hypothetical protein
MRDGLINLETEIQRLQRQVDDKLWSGEPHETDERDLEHLRDLRARGDVWLPTF